jgi:Flp pilus assembly protein TadD
MSFYLQPSRFLRAVFFCLLLSVFSISVFAQMPPEVKAIQEKMIGGQKLTPEEQKKYDDYLKALDDKLKAAMDKLKSIGTTGGANGIAKPVDLSAVKISTDPDLPKMDASAHYGSAAVPTQSEYLAIVKKYHDAVMPDLGTAKTALDKALSNAATPNDQANIGMALYMSRTRDKDETAAALYALTAAAVKNPAGGVFAGNFGVLLKNIGEYQDSLKVLLYAEKLLPQSPLVKTNLGWTIAYLGDFFTAKDRFRKAIDLDMYDSNPYEGMGLLFRVEGNEPEASKYLRMAMRTGFSAPAARNLALIEGKIDGVIASAPDSLDENSAPGMKLSDVMVFPSGGDSDKGDTGGATQAGQGKLELANSPDFFSPSIRRVDDGHLKDEFLRYDEEKKAALKDELNELERARQQVGPLTLPPVRSGDAITYPRSFEYEAYALADMEHIFARRHLLRYAKFAKKFQNEIHLPVTDKFFDLEKQFQAENKACARNEPCQDAAGRKVCRARVDNIKGKNGSFQALWTKYVQDERADLKRYFDLATPWLREIKDPKLNHYMNLRRRLFIRAADPIEELGVWGTWEADVLNNWSNDCGVDPPPADTGNYLRNKLKVFPEPYGSCHVPVYKFSGGVGFLSAATEATCDSLKVEFGAFGIVGSAETKFGEKESDDVTTFRLGTGVKEGFSGKIGDVDLGGVEVGAKGNYYIKTRDGAIIDNGVEGSAKAEGTIGNEGEGILKGYLPTTTIGMGGKIQVGAESGPQVSGSDEPAIDFGGVAEHIPGQ